jgi:hypothetical protein
MSEPMHERSARHGSPCEGWWEQRWFGRRPMDDLRLAVAPPRLTGSGDDVVGPFVLDGSIAADGGVEIRKTYVGKHQVVYLGQYDGEGRLWGTWSCCGDSGRWMIALRRGRSGANDALAADAGEPLGDIPRIAPRGR